MKKTYTKREMYELIKALVDAGVISGELTETGITEAHVAQFCVDELELLDKKVAKAKERVATKKTEADELTELIKSLLTDEWQTTTEIAAQIEDEDVSQSKITARMTKLINAGIAIKEQVSVVGANGKAAKKMSYRLVQ